MSQGNKRKRSFRFTISQILVAIALLSLALFVFKNWVLPIINDNLASREQTKRLEALGVSYHYDPLEEWGTVCIHNPNCFQEAIAELRITQINANALYLNNTNVNEPMLAALRDVRTLQRLDFRGSTLIGNELSLPQVSSLQLSGATFDWSDLANFPNVKSIRIDSDQLCEEAVASMNAMPNLVHLNIESCNTLENINDLLFSLQRVRSIGFVKTKLTFSNASVKELRQRFRVGINFRWRE